MNDEQLLIRLRNCFTGGYTLPQFCIDNKIKRPLFVAPAKFATFLWEIYVQFSFDKRMMAQFSFIDAGNASMLILPDTFIDKLNINHISQINPADIDAVICLTEQKIFSGGNVIYLDALTNYFECKIYFEIPLSSFLQRYPKVKLFLIGLPMNIRQRKGSAEFLSQIDSIEKLEKRLRTDKSGNVKTRLDKFGYTNAQVLEISEAPKVITNPDGTTIMVDDDTKPLQGIKNGKRKTAYQPENFSNKIYFVCGCHYYGIHAPYYKTVASYLQKMIVEENLPWRVENESQCFCSRGQDIYYNLNKLTPAPGDIIFVDSRDERRLSSIPFADVSDALDLINNFEKLYCTKNHMNELAYELIAKKYFAILTANNFFRDKDFNYPKPPQFIIATGYHRSSRRLARKIFLRRSWKPTNKKFAQRKFPSVLSL